MYKKFIYIFIIILASLTQKNLCQDEEVEFKTLIQEGKLGGFASFGTGYSLIDDRNSIVFTARGGIVVKHSLSIGFAGSTFMNDYQQLSSGSSLESSLVGGYGGLYIELIPLQRYSMHLSIPLTAGIGAVSYSVWDRATSDGFTQSGNIQDETTFFILEPGVELNFRITSWMKIAVYGTYRYTTPLSERFAVDNDVDRNGITGLSYGLNVKFGKF